MNSNPCLECHLKSQDKNNRICMYCDKRFDYVSHLESELSYARIYTADKLPSHGVLRFSKTAYRQFFVSNTP